MPTSPISFLGGSSATTPESLFYAVENLSEYRDLNIDDKLGNFISYDKISYLGEFLEFVNFYMVDEYFYSLRTPEGAILRVFVQHNYSLNNPSDNAAVEPWLVVSPESSDLRFVSEKDKCIIVFDSCEYRYFSGELIGINFRYGDNEVLLFLPESTRAMLLSDSVNSLTGFFDLENSEEAIREFRKNVFGDESLDDFGSCALLWIFIGGGAVVVICGAVAAALIIRKKRRRAAAES